MRPCEQRPVRLWHGRQAGAPWRPRFSRASARSKIVASRSAMIASGKTPLPAGARPEPPRRMSSAGRQIRGLA
jgi:hypothetical protein